jgi:hypothetical protein
MVRGHHAQAVHEAVARYLQWPIYHHEHDRADAPQTAAFSA